MEIEESQLFDSELESNARNDKWIDPSAKVRQWIRRRIWDGEGGGKDIHIQVYGEEIDARNNPRTRTGD